MKLFKEKNAKPQYMESRRSSGISGLVMFAVIVIAAIFVMSISFRVKDIRVTGNEHYTDSEIINAIDIEEGDNLFFFDRFAAISRVFAKLPYVEEVSVTRNLPDRVVIHVRESKAIGFIKMGTELWTLDHNCKVLGKAAEGEEETLIQIDGLQPGTMFINEPLTLTEGGDRTLDYLKTVLNEIQGRNMTEHIKKLDFTNANAVEMYYDNLYTIDLGDPYGTDHKFGMIVSAISQLLPGDTGYIDVTDAATVHFIPY